MIPQWVWIGTFLLVIIYLVEVRVKKAADMRSYYEKDRQRIVSEIKMSIGIADNTTIQQQMQESEERIEDMIRKTLEEKDRRMDFFETALVMAVKTGRLPRGWPPQQ